jgi:ribosomal protein L11 methylase PrmA
MSKGIDDKLFFRDLIDYNDVSTVVDFGCADGALLKALWDEKRRFVGYDISPKMIELALRNFDKPNIFYTTAFPEDNYSSTNSLLNISSTIHEVYSYGADIEDFWKKVFNSGFKWIAIRDMMPDQFDTDIPFDILSRFKHRCDSRRLNDYENIWGPIKTERDISHFLLKYRWLDNWEREVRENYFPVNINEILEKVPENYKVRFQHTFVLPFLKNWAFEELGVDITSTTHVKLILERR